MILYVVYLIMREIPVRRCVITTTKRKRLTGGSNNSGGDLPTLPTLLKSQKRYGERMYPVMHDTKDDVLRTLTPVNPNNLTRSPEP